MSPSRLKSLRVPLLGFLIFFSLAGFLSSWAVSSPIGSSPDDDYHLASIWCGQGFRDGLCEPGSTKDIVRVPATLITNSACFAFNPKNSGECAESTALQDAGHTNVDHGYPPVYYWVMASFASKDLTWSVLAMRMFNVAVLSALFLLLITRVPERLRRIPIAGLLLTVIPLGAFLVASVNPSGWGITAILVFFTSYLAFVQSDNRRDQWLFAGVSIGTAVFGAGTRVDSAAFMVIAIALTWVLTPAPRRPTIPHIVVTAAIVLINAAFYLSAGQNDFVTKSGAHPGFSLGNLASNIVNLPTLWIGNFGYTGLGWLDTKMPPVVWVTTLTIFTGVVISSLSRLNARRATAIAAVAGLLFALPLYVLTKQNIRVGVDVQPRYLLPLLILLVMVAAYSEKNEPRWQPSHAQWMLVAVGLFVANTVALQVNIRRYVTGTDIQGISLDAKAEWWWTNFPLSPNGVWILGSLSMAVLLVSLYAMRDRLGLVAAKTETANH